MFQFLDIAVLVASQMSVDVFLIDWERPPPTSTNRKPDKSLNSESPVSVWRTYLVANEWNEIQTKRKTSISLQVVLVILVMKVFGLENLATADPHNSLFLDDGHYHSEPSYVCR